MSAPTFAQVVIGPASAHRAAVIRGKPSSVNAELGRPWTLAEAMQVVTAEHPRVVVWIHESAHEAWKLGDDALPIAEALGGDLDDDPVSGDGWLRLRASTHVALPQLSGDFADTATPEDLALALATFEHLAGTVFLYSAPATALHLVDDRRLRRPTRPSGVAFAQSAYSIPAHVWTRPLTDAERARPYAQLFDRRGAYLAAWRSVVLPDGEWTDGRRALGAEAAAAKWPGYFLLDTRPLAPYLASCGLPDPFRRHPLPEGAAWLTAPLAELAYELADEAGIELIAERVVSSMCRVRALDRAAQAFSEAVRLLDGGPAAADPIAPVVLAVVKDAYKRGTAHLEFGRRPPHPLHRPEWRHTIIDRHVSSTFRALRRSSETPFLVGGVDSALFALEADGSAPDGLRIGGDLGSWRRRGAPIPLDVAAREIVGGRARALLFDLIEGRAVATA